MNARNIAILILPVVFAACAPKVDVQPMLDDFDKYSNDLRAAAVDSVALETLDVGQEKRTVAGGLAEQGKDKDAVPVVERAMADAQLAFEMERMNAAARRAEKCRLEVEQARTKWSEAVFVLEQTEEFVGTSSSGANRPPELTEEEELALPATTLEATVFPPATLEQVHGQWTEWRNALNEHELVAADLETAYWHSYDRARGEKTDAATEEHHRYLAARVVQMLECRVRTDLNERVCMESTQRTAAFGDARADALRMTLDLERSLQDDLRRDLDHLRAEAKTRQDELYNALSQMEGKFASIRRDARGTIVSLADILFDFDKATLRRDVEFNLVKIATILNQFGEMHVLIEGHTDAIGTEEYNLVLSKRRAEAVMQFLVSQDVVAERLSAEGYGESRPVADNETNEGRQKNRRVDLVIQDAPQ
ncbi:MAG TPA: OmpA family protein [Candidatus Krumholzibacteria bacterium]|nr:OmpA family protein [Candidatus Krumholzibacteria bacterium]